MWIEANESSPAPSLKPDRQRDWWGRDWNRRLMCYVFSTSIDPVIWQSFLALFHWPVFVYSFILLQLLLFLWRVAFYFHPFIGIRARNRREACQRKCNRIYFAVLSLVFKFKFYSFTAAFIYFFSFSTTLCTCFSDWIMWKPILCESTFKQRDTLNWLTHEI